jgi:hypothetical protein
MSKSDTKTTLKVYQNFTMFSGNRLEIPSLRYTVVNISSRLRLTTVTDQAIETVENRSSANSKFIK